MFDELTDEEVLYIRDVVSGIKEIDPIIEEHIMMDIEIIRFNIKNATNILKKYEMYRPEYNIKLITMLTDRDIQITYRDVPTFKQFVITYGTLLRRLRTQKINGV